MRTTVHPGPASLLGRLRLDVAGLPETGRRLSRSSGVISWLNVEGQLSSRWPSAWVYRDSWYSFTGDRE
ncbi:MAG UNVERIFIED_CONTAM: hypothetical protein LVR18_13620 [Planctomycetaceae bacterium]